ncbi:TetR/AcrR family transcriptional regulator [Gordonia effusa]|nr:TetR/AcrR family transcriptional regulator [Gordonia effusa]
MPRPRLHDLDELMDAAEKLAVESGPASVTVRALSQVTGASNGAIYHAFGSRSGLLGQVCLRAAQRFLDLQRAAVDQEANPIDAVVAAADSPAEFSIAFGTSGRFLLTVDRAELLGSREMPTDVATQLQALEGTLTELFIRLAQAMWGRGDREAVAVIRDCVVELPTALLLRRDRTPDAAARARLAAAVRAILALEPPAPQPRNPNR